MHVFSHIIWLFTIHFEVLGQVYAPTEDQGRLGPWTSDQSTKLGSKSDEEEPVLVLQTLDAENMPKLNQNRKLWPVVSFVPRPQSSEEAMVRLGKNGDQNRQAAQYYAYAPEYVFAGDVPRIPNGAVEFIPDETVMRLIQSSRSEQDGIQLFGSSSKVIYPIKSATSTPDLNLQLFRRAVPVTSPHSTDKVYPQPTSTRASYAAELPTAYLPSGEVLISQGHYSRSAQESDANSVENDEAQVLELLSRYPKLREDIKLIENFVNNNPPARQ